MQEQEPYRIRDIVKDIGSYVGVTAFISAPGLRGTFWSLDHHHSPLEVMSDTLMELFAPLSSRLRKRDYNSPQTGAFFYMFGLVFDGVVNNAPTAILLSGLEQSIRSGKDFTEVMGGMGTILALGGLKWATNSITHFVADCSGLWET